MNTIKRNLICAMSLISFAAVGCLGTTAGTTNATPGTYALTVTSVNPTSGLSLTVSPADNNNAGTSGAQVPQTGLSLIYNAGTSVTITAPATNSPGAAFYAWVGCDSTTGFVCNVTMSKSKSVQLEYAGVSSIVINPYSISVARGGGVQVGVTVNGFGMCSLPSTTGPPTQVQCAGSPFTCAGYVGTSGSLGTLDPATCYYTPDPTSPASEIVVTATSSVSPIITATGLITLQQ